MRGLDASASQLLRVLLPRRVRRGLVGLLGPDALPAAHRRLEGDAAAVLRETRAFYVAIDEDGEVLAWNSAAARVFGWTEEEALGQSVHELIVPSASRAAHLAGVEHFRATGRGRGLDGPVEVEALRRDGSTVPVELGIWAQPTDAGWVFHVLGHDLSARRAQSRVLELLSAHRHGLLRSPDADTVRALLCRTAREAGTADGAYLYEVVPGPGAGSRLRLAASAVGLAGALPHEVVLDGRVHELLLSQDRVAVPDLSTASWPEAEHLRAGGLRSAVVEGLRQEGELIGVLVLGWVGPRPLPEPEDQRLLGLLASEATLVVERLALQEQLAEAARTDALTGLLNRRAFDDSVQRAIERAGSEPLALVMLDLDDFKALNDARGHPAGDVHLQRVADAWRAALGDRPGELYRFGGDEFALLLPTGCDDALVVVADLVAATPPPTGVTAGCAVLEPGDDGARLLARADEDLYARKRSRRR